MGETGALSISNVPEYKREARLMRQVLVREIGRVQSTWAYAYEAALALQAVQLREAAMDSEQHPPESAASQGTPA